MTIANRTGCRILACAAALAARNVALHAQAAHASIASRDTVDRLITAHMARKHIPGVSLAVVRAGKVIRAGGYGVADLENNTPVTPQTVFKIGSVSKQFLAAGIMLLVQDGRVSVDDPVSRYFANAPDSWRAITLRHLLSHTSGVLREGPAFDALRPQPDSVVILSAFPQPLEFSTGSKYQYCNVCYFTLAEIIARVSGQPWDAFLADRVFRPLSMSNTRTTTVSALVPHRARGYTWRESGYVNAPEYLALRPSGAFLSTTGDLAKWDAALYHDRPLTSASRTAMWAPTRLTGGGVSNYGFGWGVDSMAGRWRVSHGGSLPGFRAHIERFPNDSLTIIVLTNADGARPEEIADGVATIYLRGAPRPTTSVRTERGEPATASKVLFVCEHGTVKSLLAKVMFEQYARQVGLHMQAESRGTRADSVVPPWMLRGLAMDHVDLGTWRPQSLQASDLATASYVVSLDVPQAATAAAPAPRTQWDGLPPVSQDYAKGRDAIKVRVHQLVDSLKRAAERTHP